MRMTRPPLRGLLPKKRIFNRVLFDQDSRLSYRQTLPVLEAVYKHIDEPANIALPKGVRGSDLMACKNVLGAVRLTTGAMNENLVALENELVEQAAELGDNDAIAMLAFGTVSKRVGNKGAVEDADFRHANSLISQLVELRHALVFKMAGDMAFKQGHHQQAAEYWNEFLAVEPDTIRASQVHVSLGTYYFTYMLQLDRARYHFEKSVALGEHQPVAHYYLGQLCATTHPETARWHWEHLAGRGLRESFAPLGFLEMDVFGNLAQAKEWFRLGAAAGDVTSMVGLFDVQIRLGDNKAAHSVLVRLEELKSKVEKGSVTDDALTVFFDTRAADIQQVTV